MSKKTKKNELKSALLTEGGEGEKDNEMMQQLKGRMTDAHRRMSLATQQKNLIDLSALNPIKGFEKAQEKADQVAHCMNSKRIFIMYGMIDFCIFMTVLGYTIAYKLGVMFIGLILLYVPNVALFCTILCADSVNSRAFYQKWLRFKLIFMGFLLPLIFLHQAESSWESAICSDYLNGIDLGQGKKFDMSQDQMQEIIEKDDFSLLISTDSMQLQQTSASEYNQKSTAELVLTDMGMKAGNAMRKLSRNVVTTFEDTKELNQEELQMRYIQFCGTTVLLGSLAFIVVYQMFNGHQYFVARGRHIQILQQEEFGNKLLSRFNVIHEDKMTKFEQGDADFLLKELQAAAEALGKQVELKKQKSLTYSEAESNKDGFTTAIN